MRTRDTGKLVFERTLDYQTGAQGFGRLIHRRDDVAASLNPGALIYKAEALPGPTVVVLYCNDKECDESVDRYFYTVSAYDLFARWDSDPTIQYPRDFNTSFAPHTVGRFQFYGYDPKYSPGDCPRDVFKVRLRPANGINDSLRIYMNAHTDYDSKTGEPFQRPEWTICAIQLGGKTLKKTFTPSYRTVYTGSRWSPTTASDEDLAVSLNFNGRGELISIS